MRSLIHCCTLGGNAYLESMAIAKLNEIMDTMNMESMLQGDDPPMLFDLGIQI